MHSGFLFSTDVPVAHPFSKCCSTMLRDDKSMPTIPGEKRIDITLTSTLHLFHPVRLHQDFPPQSKQGHPFFNDGNGSSGVWMDPRVRKLVLTPITSRKSRSVSCSSSIRFSAWTIHSLRKDEGKITLYLPMHRQVRPYRPIFSPDFSGSSGENTVPDNESSPCIQVTYRLISSMTASANLIRFNRVPPQ